MDEDGFFEVAGFDGPRACTEIDRRTVGEDRDARESARQYRDLRRSYRRFFAVLALANAGCAYGYFKFGTDLVLPWLLVLTVTLAVVVGRASR